MFLSIRHVPWGFVVWAWTILFGGTTAAMANGGAHCGGVADLGNHAAVSEVAMWGSYLVSADDLGLSVWTGTDLWRGGWVGPSSPTSLAVHTSGFAYVGFGAAGLAVVDIRQPTAPRLADFLDLGGVVRALAISGDFAFVTGADTFGLKIFDLADPGRPQPRGEVPLTGWAGRVAISGQVALVAAVGDGVRVVSVADPDHPVLVKTVATASPAVFVAAGGGRAWRPTA